MKAVSMNAVRAVLALLSLVAFLTVLAMVPTTQPVGAQSKAGRGPADPSGHPQEPKKKVDEKGYKASLGRIPDQKFDPWGKIRQ